MTILKVLPLAILLLLTPMINAGGKKGLSPEDIARIKQAHSRYETAWLKGNADEVRVLFTDDCVLLPPHGDKPHVGQKGLSEFWFPPDAPPTTVTKLVLTPEKINGDGEIATAWGTFEVAWTTVQDGKSTESSHKGIFLNVLRKQPDGEWKFTHHMWDQPVAQH